MTLGVVVAATMLVRAWGKSRGRDGLGSPTEFPLQSIHFAGAGVWIGAVFLLVLWLARPARADGSTMGVALGVSRWALIGLAAVAVTGVLRSLQELGGVSGWLHAFASSYGTVLAIKVAIGVVLVGLGRAEPLPVDPARALKRQRRDALRPPRRRSRSRWACSR